MSTSVKYSHLFGGVYSNRRVLVTGHTGFKGSWLTALLSAMGANILGFSLPPNTKPNHFELIKCDLNLKSVIGDVKDVEKFINVCKNFQPEIVFHLAAQPLVLLSYEIPLETLNTNILGTANILEACRQTTSVRAIVNVTSDKCYKNREWIWGYRENDPMGGYDPYSASKGCSELITSAYRNSYFNPDFFGKRHQTLISSARAGNVIGGGDWCRDRIVPDMMKAASSKKSFRIRNPFATRPWQHVLDPLSGYLLLGQRLFEGITSASGAWNFGPHNEENIPVKDVVKSMQKSWSHIKFTIKESNEIMHEAKILKLDCSKSNTLLKWKPVWNTNDTFEKTVEWYKKFYTEKITITHNQVDEYIYDANSKKLCWTK